MNFRPIRILLSILVLVSAQSYAQEKIFAPEEWEYHKEYGAAVAKEMSAYFDNENPSYHSPERRNALYLVDALTHYPSPHDDWLKDFFLGRYRKAIEGIKNTDVQTGAMIWNVYNMVYIVKTNEIMVAFDLTCLPPPLRVEDDEGRYEKLAKELMDLCDVLFVSHIHGDHADEFVAGEFIKQKKAGDCPAWGVQKNRFPSQGVASLSGWRAKQAPGSDRDVELLLRIYPGHQQVSATGTVENNFIVVPLPRLVFPT